MANNQQLVKTVENLKSRYSFGHEGYKPNFIIVNNGSGGNEMSPTLKMFGSFLTEMRQFNADLLKAIEKLNDVVAVNTTYTKEIQEIEKKKDDKKNPKAVKEDEKNQFNPSGGNYHKVYATAIANQFKKDSALGKLYHKVTPDSIQMVLGGAFSAGKGLWNLNKSLRGALKVDKEAKAQKKQGKRYDEESGTWVAKDSPQGESKKEKGKLSKAIGGLTSFLKKGKKEKEGGGFLSNLLGGLGLMRIFGGVGKLGSSIFGIITGFSLLKPLITGLISAFPNLTSAISGAAEALVSFGGKAWDCIKEMAVKAWDGLGKAKDKVVEAGKGVYNKAKDGIKGAYNKTKDLAKSGVNKAMELGKNAKDGIKGLWNKGVDKAKSIGGSIWETITGKGGQKAAQSAAVKAGTKVGARAALSAIPGAGQVATAGLVGYEIGDYLNNRFGLSNYLLDGIEWVKDKGYNLLHNQLSYSERDKVAKNPEAYSLEKRQYAAISDYMDAKREYNLTDGDEQSKRWWKSCHAKYGLGSDKMPLDMFPELEKSKTKTDINLANQNTIKEAAVEKRVEESGGANKQPPTVINNTPVTNVYNNNTTGGGGSMSARNTDASYIRNIDGNTAAFAY